jgi:hypothetical protein
MMLKNCKRPSLLRSYATYYKQAWTRLSANKDALPEGLNFDLAAKDIDEPLATDELRSMRAFIGIRDGVLKTSGKSNPSTHDFVTFGGRVRTANTMVGGPQEIADREEMFVRRGCDGFVIAATYVPGPLRRFRSPHRTGIAKAESVSQELHWYDPCEGNLGLPRPAAGSRKHQSRIAPQ